jgi:hypothetical protein
MMLFTLRIIIFLVIILGCSCSRQDSQSVASKYSGNIQSLLSSAPISVINLDSLKGDTADAEMVIGHDPLSRPEEESQPFLGQPLGCIVKDDSLYITDERAHCIIVSDLNGHLTREIGRQGKGPGEFERPSGIVRNDSLVLVHDVGNMRIQIFDLRMNYLAGIPTGFFPFMGSIAANNSHIYVPSSILDSCTVSLYAAHRPFGFLHSLGPTVLRPGEQPIGINSVKIATSRAGSMCFGYAALPYVFAFDSMGQQYASIRFEGKPVELLDEPPPSNMRISGQPIRKFIFALSILDDRTITIAGRANIYVLRLVPHDRYFLSQRLILRNLGKGQIWSILCTKDKLYVCVMGQSGIRRFSLRCGITNHSPDLAS